MDKLSRYNIVVSHKDWRLMYNTLCNSLVCYTSSEYDAIKMLLDNLPLFGRTYPKLYEGLKASGFIIGHDKDELELIKLLNKSIVFNKEYCHLTVNPTLDCNLTCWYCSTEYAKVRHCGRMTDDTVVKVKRHIRHLIEIQKIKRFHLDWFGGEPLMYFKEVIEPISSYALGLCRKNDVFYTQHVTSNSTLITEEMAERMNDLHFCSFQITLDGDEDRHDRIKFFSDLTGMYRKIIDNINLLCNKIPEVGIILRINFDRKTLYRIQNILQDIKTEAKKHIIVDFQKVWQVDWNNEDNIRLKEIKDLFEKNGLHSNYWAYHPRKFFKCYADQRGHYAINYNGEVFKCTARDYGKDKIIGMLKDNGRIEWNRELISKMFEKPLFENRKCLACKILPVCMGPCIMNNYEAKISKREVRCVLDAVQYSVDDFIIDEAYKRNLIAKV